MNQTTEDDGNDERNGSQAAGAARMPDSLRAAFAAVDRDIAAWLDGCADRMENERVRHWRAETTRQEYCVAVAALAQEIRVLAAILRRSALSNLGGQV